MRVSFLLLIFLSSCTYNELVPVCEPDEKVFQDIVQPIIEINCVSCHDESSGRPSVLTTYDGVIDAINSHGLRDEIVSLRMPLGTPPLSESDINIFVKWIDCE